MKSKFIIFYILLFISCSVIGQTKQDSIFCNKELVKFTLAKNVLLSKHFPKDLKTFILFKNGNQFSVSQTLISSDEGNAHSLEFEVLIPKGNIKDYSDRQKLLNSVKEICNPNEFLLASYLNDGLIKAINNKGIMDFFDVEKNSLKLIIGSTVFDSETVINIKMLNEKYYFLHVIYNITL